MTRRYIETLRKIIEMLSEHLTDEEALDAPDLFPHWSPDKDCEAGQRLCYESKLYKVLQAHTSQADWLPTTAVSLYVEVAPPDVIPDWKQPTGAHDAYNTGDRVRYNGQIWECTIDANVYAPDVYGWEVVS